MFLSKKTEAMCGILIIILQVSQVAPPPPLRDSETYYTNSELRILGTKCQGCQRPTNNSYHRLSAWRHQWRKILTSWDTSRTISVAHRKIMWRNGWICEEFGEVGRRMLEAIFYWKKRGEGKKTKAQMDEGSFFLILSVFFTFRKVCYYRQESVFFYICILREKPFLFLIL